MQSLAEIHGLATGEVSFTIDSEAGFTFAKLDLQQLQLDAQLHRRERPPDQPHRPQSGRGAGDLRRADGRHQARQPLLAHRRVHHARHRRQGEQRLHEGPIGLELLEYFFAASSSTPTARPRSSSPSPGDLARPDVTGYVDIGGGAGPAELGAARPRRQAHARGAVGPHRRDAEVDRAHPRRGLDREGQDRARHRRASRSIIGRRAPSRRASRATSRRASSSGPCPSRSATPRAASRSTCTSAASGATRRGRARRP